MTIGILTFYREANFGANLQGVSTYMYLKKHGHTPVFIHYRSKEDTRRWEILHNDIQFKAHNEFVNQHIKNQTEICHDIHDLNRIISQWSIEAIIIGSDAVLQHHPFLARIKRGRRKPIHIIHYSEEKMFPNLFWGVGYAHIIPTAMMSVSSQNSEYKYITNATRLKMKNVLSSLKFVSVRDTWTCKMVKKILQRDVPVTPDPVFAFNYNAAELIPSKDEILKKYNLPEKYALISLRTQSLSLDILDELQKFFNIKGVKCVALTMPKGIKFAHHFDYEIQPPLSPNDWYALIKYASAYIGSNMHPIIVSLHNAVPCVSIDNWGRTNFWGRKIRDDSSKVKHIMEEFGVGQCHQVITYKTCNTNAKEIFELIESFPIDKVQEHSNIMYQRYEQMMHDILNSIRN